MPGKGDAAVRDNQSKTEASTNMQVLFPMAVGAVFLVVLLMGALLS